MIIFRERIYSTVTAANKVIKEKSFSKYKLSAPEFVKEGGLFNTGKLTRSIVITPKENLQSIGQDIKDFPKKLRNGGSPSRKLKTALERAKLKILNGAVNIPKKIERVKQYPGKTINEAINFATDSTKGGPVASTTWAALTSVAPGLPGITPISLSIGKNSKYIPGVETVNYVAGNVGKSYQRSLGKVVDRFTGYGYV